MEKKRDDTTPNRDRGWDVGVPTYVHGHGNILVTHLCTLCSPLACLCAWVSYCGEDQGRWQVLLMVGMEEGGATCCESLFRQAVATWTCPQP